MYILRNLALKDVEAVIRRCSIEKAFLKISQNSRETPAPESFQ